MLRMIIIGPQGSGKGTYASRLSPIYNIPQIATGDLIREEIKSKTEVGMKIEGIVKEGKLVPDEIVLGILKKRLEKDDTKNGFILDGYPRTLSQAEALEGITQIDVVLNLVVPQKVIIERLSTRIICPKCGAIYNKKTLPPKVEGICDKCGAALIQRDDDKPAAIKARLATFKKETTPVIEYYKNKGIVINIKPKDPNAAPEDVVKEIVEKIDKFLKVQK